MAFALKDYIDVINPKTYKEAIPRLAKVEDNAMTAAHILLSTFISLAFMAVSMVLSIQQVQSYPAEYQQEMQGLFATEQKMFLTPVGIVLTFITSIISTIIALWILHQVCRIMGGKGKLGNQLYVTSMTMLSMSVVYAPILLLNLVPLVSCVASLCGLVFGLYGIYLYYITARAVHPELDNVKGAATVVIWMLASFAIGMVVFFARFAIGI